LKILTDIQDHLRQTNVVEKLLYANVFVYIVSVLFPVGMTHYFALSSQMTAIVRHPWTIFTYAFIHIRLFHILSNLIVLYYIGQLFLDFFTPKKFLIYYFSSLIVGGLMFVLYYSISPTTTHYSLIGASAAVTGILIGLATKIPHYALYLRFIGRVELWILAAIWIVLSAFTAAGINAGSGIAHLGGALTGFLLTSYLNEGAWFSKISFQNKKSKSPFKTVYKSKIKTKQSYRHSKENEQRVNAILDKISKSGYDALSQEEKEFLFNQKSH